MSIDEDPKKYKERIVNQKKEEWENKQMQGQYLRQIKEIVQDG